MQSIITAKEISAATTVATVVDSSNGTVIDSSGNEVTSYYTYPEPSQKQFKIVSKYVSNLGHTSKLNAANFSDTPSSLTFQQCHHSLSYLGYYAHGTQNAYRLGLLTATSSTAFTSAKMHVIGLSGYGGSYNFLYERDVSTASSLHSGWGTIAYCFTPDGRRMYAIQSNGTSSRWGYYTLTSPYGINGGAVTFTVSSGPATGINASHMIMKDGILSVMFVSTNPADSSKRNMTINSYRVPSNGYFTTTPTQLATRLIEAALPEDTFSQFSFTPDGMNIIVGRNETEFNAQYTSVFLEKALIYPLKQN